MSGLGEESFLLARASFGPAAVLLRQLDGKQSPSELARDLMTSRFLVQRALRQLGDGNEMTLPPPPGPWGTSYDSPRVQCPPMVNIRVNAKIRELLNSLVTADSSKHSGMSKAFRKALETYLELLEKVERHAAGNDSRLVRGLKIIAHHRLAAAPFLQEEPLEVQMCFRIGVSRPLYACRHILYLLTGEHFSTGEIAACAALYAKRKAHRDS